MAGQPSDDGPANPMVSFPPFAAIAILPGRKRIRNANAALAEGVKL
jgi:hypothetical protein